MTPNEVLTDSVLQEFKRGGKLMLPKLHPLTKTYIELNRCETRLDEFIARFPEDRTNDVELYMKLHNLIQQAKDLIPEEFTGRA